MHLCKNGLFAVFPKKREFLKSLERKYDGLWNFCIINSALPTSAASNSDLLNGDGVLTLYCVSLKLPLQLPGS